MRRPFPLTSLCLLAAAALLGCALDTRAPGDSTEGVQSGSSDLTSAASTAAATPAAHAVLSVTGGGGAPPFDFGGAVAGSPVVRAFTITNTGTATSAALSTVSLSGASDFTLVAGASPCAGAKLAVGKSCSVVVVYTPAAAGRADAATLTVSDGSAKVTAALSGLGITSGVDYVVSPNPGNLALSPGQSGHLTFKVVNAGSAAGPAITHIGTDGDGGYSWFHIASDGCTGSPGLGVLASCTFQVDVMVPAAPSQETSTYYLAVAGAGVVAPGNATVAYSKAIVTLPPAVDYVLSPNPGNVSVAPGATGRVTFTVTNEGWQSGPTLTGIGLDGSSPTFSWFSRKTDACTGAHLAPGGACTFEIDVAVPASAAAQTTHANVAVTASGAIDPAGDTAIYTLDDVTVP